MNIAVVDDAAISAFYSIWSKIVPRNDLCESGKNSRIILENQIGSMQKEKVKRAG